MAFDRRLLNPEEEILLDLRPHWWFLLPQIGALGAALVLAGVVLAFVNHQYARYGAAAVLVAAIVWFGLRWLRWNGINFVVTSDRLIFRTGVVAKQGIEIPLERINTVLFAQSMVERIVGKGDLTVESAGEAGQQYFDNVWRPNRVQQEIYRAIDLNERRMHESMAEAHVEAIDEVAAAREPTIPEQIDQLDQLRIRGVITDREFQTKKTELLDRM